MSQEYMRTFQAFHLDEVTHHLLIMGDLTANCASCNELGIDPHSARNCPHCGNEIKYITSRRLESNPGERFQFVRKMKERRPDLIVIDYEDYTKLLGKKKARDFFG